MDKIQYAAYFVIVFKSLIEILQVIKVKRQGWGYGTDVPRSWTRIDFSTINACSWTRVGRILACLLRLNSQVRVHMTDTYLLKMLQCRKY